MWSFLEKEQTQVVSPGQQHYLLKLKIIILNLNIFLNVVYEKYLIRGAECLEILKQTLYLLSIFFHFSHLKVIHDFIPTFPMKPKSSGPHSR